jgi:hypothetical protein
VLSRGQEGQLANKTFTVSVTDVGGKSTSQSKTFSVPAFAQQGTTLAVGASSGNDAYVFAQGTTAGTVVVKDNAATLGTFTTAQVQVYGGGGTNTITVNGLSTGTAFTVGSTSVVIPGVSISGSGIGTWAVNGVGGTNTFTVNGSGLHAALKCGSGNDTFTVAAGVAFDGTINGGGGSGIDTLVGQSAAGGNRSWVVSGANAGTLDGASFTGIANLTGGTGADSFQIQTGGSLSGKIDGAGGANWLDYSSWTKSVSVNLSGAKVGMLVANAATNVFAGAANGVSNVLNARGGLASDTLIGGGGNILVGGGGNDTLTDTYGGSAASGGSLLIGGAGADAITGGHAGDILIGGATIHDALNANLQDILTAWDTLGHASAFSLLQGAGAGATHSKLIFGTTSTATVNDDGNADKLTGAVSPVDVDWFFAGAGDSTNARHGKDYLNNGLAP